MAINLQDMLLTLQFKDEAMEKFNKTVQNIKAITKDLGMDFKNLDERQIKTTIKNMTMSTAGATDVFENLGISVNRSTAPAFREITDVTKKMTRPFEDLHFQFLSIGLLFMQVNQQFAIFNQRAKKMTTDIGFMVLQYSLLSGQMPSLMFLTRTQIELGRAIRGLPEPLQKIVGGFTVFGEVIAGTISNLGFWVFALPQIKTALPLVTGALKSFGGSMKDAIIGVPGMLTKIKDGFVALKQPISEALGRIAAKISSSFNMDGATKGISKFGTGAIGAFTGIGIAAILVGGTIAAAWDDLMLAQELRTEAAQDKIEGDIEQSNTKILLANARTQQGLIAGFIEFTNQVGFILEDFGILVVKIFAKLMKGVVARIGVLLELAGQEKLARRLMRGVEDFEKNIIAGETERILERSRQFKAIERGKEENIIRDVLSRGVTFRQLLETGRFEAGTEQMGALERVANELGRRSELSEALSQFHEMQARRERDQNITNNVEQNIQIEITPPTDQDVEQFARDINEAVSKEMNNVYSGTVNG